MGLTHLDENGKVVMVDVGSKADTNRVARSRGTIRMSKDAYNAIITDSVKKGNVFATAKIAAIMAAKNTSNTIPLCHPLAINQVSVEFFPDNETASIEVEATVSVSGKTGVEMEAMHAASIALLTIYDMCKAVDRNMLMGEIRLIEKTKNDI